MKYCDRTGPLTKMKKNALPTLLLWLALGAFAMAEPASETIDLPSFNGRYVDFLTEIKSVEYGPLLVEMTSPKHTFELRRTSLELTPVGGDEHTATIRVEFLGDAEMIADVNVVGVVSRFEDNVVVPQQEQEFDTTVRMKHSEGGYEVTTVELPKTISIDIESELAARIVGLCEAVSLLSLGGTDCSLLERALSKAVLPLPPPGDTFLVEYHHLTANERADLDKYLARP